MRRFFYHLLAGTMISLPVLRAQEAREEGKSALPVREMDPARQWAQFRGYRARGILPGSGLPVSWSVEKN